MPSPDPALIERYAASLASLLPEGPFWAGFNQPDGQGYAILSSKAEGLAAVHGRADDLIRDSIPLHTREMLASREYEAGLPGVCQVLPTSLQARVDALVAQWSARGGANAAYFVEVGKALGYDITITSGRARFHGLRRHGGDYGGPDMQAVMTVNAAEINYRERRHGFSLHGDRYADWGNEVLECVIQRLAPAHVIVKFSYT